MQALENGAIDAAVLDGVFSRRLKEKGFNITGEYSELKHLFTSQAIVVQGKFLQQRADMVENLLKAQVEAIAFSLAPKKKATVIKTFMRRLRVDAAAAEEGYADLHRAMDRKPYSSPEGLRNVQRLMALRSPKVGDVKSTMSSTTASFAGSMKAASSTKPTRCKESVRNDGIGNN
jgi:ABC-type nitrate/sulfonate/bicarbonate transport system substrate-binding protein